MAWSEYSNDAITDEFVTRWSSNPAMFRKQLDVKNYESFLTPGADGKLNPKAFRGDNKVAVARLMEAMRRGLGDTKINWIGGDQTVSEYYYDLIRDVDINRFALAYDDALRKYAEANNQQQPQGKGAGNQQNIPQQNTAQQPQSEAQNAKGDNAPSVKTQAEQVGARGFKTEEEMAQERFAENQRKSEALQRQHDEQGREYEERRLAFEGRMKQRELANATREANYRANMEALHAKKGLSAQDIQSRMANIRRAYGKDISDDQWRSATGFDPNADIGAMGRADRQRYIQALDNLAGRVDRYNQGQAALQRRQQAQAYQRQIMEQRGHWSNGGYQSVNRPVFAPNGMTAAQVDFSNRLKAQRMAREMSPTTRGQRAAYGRMLNDGTVTSMNIASFQGMGMQGDRLNQAIGATTGGQAYLDMRDAIAFQRDYMMKEAEMRGRRSAAAMGALATNSLSGGSPNDPGTQAAVDTVVNGTPPPTPVQAQAQPQQAQQLPSGFKVADNVPQGVNEDEYYAARGYREMNNPMDTIERTIANDPRNQIPARNIVPGTDQSGDYDKNEVYVHANGL